MSARTPDAANGETALAIICGGGSLPFALADAAVRRGRRVVLFALREWADPERVAAYPHHWSWIGQFGRFQRLAAQENFRAARLGILDEFDDPAELPLVLQWSEHIALIHAVTHRSDDSSAGGPALGDRG